MTVPLPKNLRARTPVEREKARDKLARKWAYLVSTTTYVPMEHAELERALRELVDIAFDLVVRNKPQEATALGTRLVALHCVDAAVVQITVDQLVTALLTDQDTRDLDKVAERVARLAGAVSAGFTEGIRRHTTDQQEGVSRAVLEAARKAVQEAEDRQAEYAELDTELSLLRRQLSHQLLHDALTGLPNRQFFTTRLEEVLNSGVPSTLFRIELNGVPVLNDGLGWPKTDTFLTATAVRLRTAVAGDHTMVARLDRNSFAVLQEHRPHTLEPEAVVAKINEALAETVYVHQLGLATTANIGVVRCPPHRPDPVAFLNAADMALRYARDSGPGQWQLLAPDDDLADRRRHRLAAIMPGAWETGKLRAGYRVRVRLADEVPVAVDAVPRWEEAGLRGQECALLGEETGLSPQFGRWFLEQAAVQLQRWSNSSGSDLPLSVRLTPVQSMTPELVASVLDVLDVLSLPPERLQVALASSAVFGGRALSNLTGLAEAGVQTAVHDFGDVPSDVARLADLPLGMVVLTPRLVALARGAGTASIVTEALTGLITFVHLAGATVSVDGIANRLEAAWWHRARADFATGPMYTPSQDKGEIASLFVQ